MNNTKERKKVISKYLRAYGCRPSLDGFPALESVILLSLDNEDLNCTELFRLYETGVTRKNSKQKYQNEQWRRCYRSIRYCMQKAGLNEEFRGPYDFIKHVAFQVKDDCPDIIEDQFDEAQR